MKYLPTIDLWNPAIASAVSNGQIQLQVGQWVKCGSDKKSRFVCRQPKSGTIWAAHWQGNAKDTQKRFKILINAAKTGGYL